LIDRSDEDWQETCPRVIEFLSRLSGVAYDFIVPTDGKVLDNQFCALLEAFDPDRIHVYQKSFEDLQTKRPDEYLKILESDVTNAVTQFGQSEPANRERLTQQIDKQLRRVPVSRFGIPSAQA
jgi:hypothetical protein